MKLNRSLYVLAGLTVLHSCLLLAGQAGPSAAPGLAVKVLVQSPADTQTDLQILCLFRSSAENPLHGALTEMDEKLHGLVTLLRSPQFFGGDLGETLLLTPPAGTLSARRVLIIGLGDSATFTPERMYLIGKIAYREAARLGVAHPFFAPTVLDGGVAKYGTGEVAEQVVRGMRDAAAGEAMLAMKNAAPASTVADFIFLAGAKHAADTRDGIARAGGPGAAAQR